ERSETHHLNPLNEVDGFRCALPIPRQCRDNKRCRHPRRRVTQYPRDDCEVPRRRGVLDRPVKPGDDSVVVVQAPITVIARSEATKQSSFLRCRTMDCFAALAMTMSA
ncbi:MAG TPA: hypothetical protein VMT08_11795, partial [Bradyrhizobium sp.]|nr:hypothetical protein [Bradyrhizobium sp.]